MLLELLLIVAVLAHFYLLFALVQEIKRIRVDLNNRIGSMVEASWRIRDELTAMNKRAEGQG
jgi:hypothetical protein